MFLNYYCVNSTNYWPALILTAPIFAIFLLYYPNVFGFFQWNHICSITVSIHFLCTKTVITVSKFLANRHFLNKIHKTGIVTRFITAAVFNLYFSSNKVLDIHVSNSLLMQVYDVQYYQAAEGLLPQGTKGSAASRLDSGIAIYFRATFSSYLYS